jgi:hypothetical protein
MKRKEINITLDKMDQKKLKHSNKYIFEIGLHLFV